MRNYLRLVALLLVTFVGLSACDLFGDDDESWGGLGPGALGDTLNINVTIANEREIDADFNVSFPAYEHTAGRSFSLVVGDFPTETLDTDDSDDAVVTLSGGTPSNSVLETPADFFFDNGVTSSNADAVIAEAVITSSDGGDVSFDTTNLTSFIEEMIIYSSEATVLGGTTSDGGVFSDVSLSAGWNVIIVQIDDAGRTYTNATPGTSGAWTFQLF